MASDPNDYMLSRGFAANERVVFIQSHPEVYFRRQFHNSYSQDYFTTLPIQRRPQLFSPPQHSHRQTKPENRRNRRWDGVSTFSFSLSIVIVQITSAHVIEFNTTNPPLLPSIWLIELARTLPPSTQLDGLDVNFEQSPPKEWLPANISLIMHDMLSEPPPSLLEAYDIIHVQLFITILRDGNPVPMLHNLMNMLSESFLSKIQYVLMTVIYMVSCDLKFDRSICSYESGKSNHLDQYIRPGMNNSVFLEPGGHIQWVEWDVNTWEINTWEITRVPSAHSQSNDELERLPQRTSSPSKNKPSPSFMSSGFVKPPTPSSQFPQSTSSQNPIMINWRRRYFLTLWSSLIAG